MLVARRRMPGVAKHVKRDISSVRPAMSVVPHAHYVANA